jgi:ElaB/YqjD/DUF883 family membrane-anchored ribosome-binding protein
MMKHLRPCMWIVCSVFVICCAGCGSQEEDVRSDAADKSIVVRDKHEEQLRSSLDALGAEIEQLKQKTQEVADAAVDDFNADMNRLAKKQQEAYAQLEKLAGAADERWAAAKQEMNTSMQELETDFREVYADVLQSTIDTTSETVDTLRAEGEDLTGSAAATFNANMQALADKQREALEELKMLRSKTGEAWNEARKRAEDTLNAYMDTFRETAGKYIQEPEKNAQDSA